MMVMRRKGRKDDVPAKSPDSYGICQKCLLVCSITRCSVFQAKYSKLN